MVSWCSRLSHVSHTHGVLSSSLSETILFPFFFLWFLLFLFSSFSCTLTHMHAHTNKTKKHNGVFLLIITLFLFHSVGVSSNESRFIRGVSPGASDTVGFGGDAGTEGVCDGRDGDDMIIVRR